MGRPCSPGCGHCQNAKPKFAEAAEGLKDDHSKAFAAVDCTADGGWWYDAIDCGVILGPVAQNPITLPSAGSAKVLIFFISAPVATSMDLNHNELSSSEHCSAGALVENPFLQKYSVHLTRDEANRAPNKRAQIILGDPGTGSEADGKLGLERETEGEGESRFPFFPFLTSPLPLCRPSSPSALQSAPDVHYSMSQETGDIMWFFSLPCFAYLQHCATNTTWTGSRPSGITRSGNSSKNTTATDPRPTSCRSCPTRRNLFLRKKPTENLPTILGTNCDAPEQMPEDFYQRWSHSDPRIRFLSFATLWKGPSLTQYAHRDHTINSFCTSRSDVCERPGDFLSKCGVAQRAV